MGEKNNQFYEQILKTSQMNEKQTQFISNLHFNSY